ncbi:ATP-binding protein [Crocosphaera sp.]|uniref:AAA family ATPase n=1 Tax=Crocosphaera sp. TaxID=2729996 RepID=UPI00262C4F86|nr:ATP-binding protein [Crocosphaera sp.]MDJ0580035.1 AAA family ATPase [Crocosphaera sp.]
MKNLESLTIHQFRGLKDVKLENLGQINVLVGFNNSGKTSVLEAIQIYCNPLNIRVWLNVANQRKQDITLLKRLSIEALQWLFPGSKKPIMITTQGMFIIKKIYVNYKAVEEIGFFDRRSDHQLMLENIEDIEDDDLRESRNVVKLSIEVGFNNDQNDPQLFTMTKELEIRDKHPISIDSKFYSLSSIFISAYSHISEKGLSRLLSEVRMQDFKTNVLELLQQVDPNISDLEILNSPSSTSSGFEVYIQHDQLGLTPVSNLGDGLRRLLYISLIIIQAKGGVLLIDEIESSIHTEALKFSMQWLVKWCKELDIQLFATTHSLEAVDAILEVTEPTTDLVFYRLENKETYTKVVRHPGERLKRLREELGQEVRW